MTVQARPSMASVTPTTRDGRAAVRRPAGTGSALRLLVIFPSLARGGTEEYALRIASAARGAGWEVHGGWPDVSAMRSLAADWKDRAMTYHPLGIPVANDSPTTLTRWHHAVRCARTLALLGKVRPKVVLLALPWPTFGLGALAACAVRRVPTMASFQLVPWPAAVVGKTLRAYQWARTRRQLWVVNSADGQRNLSETFRIAPRDIRIIRNGVNVSEFARELPGAERADVRRQVRTEFGLAPDARLLVTVARLHHQKGYGDLLAAARTVAREFADVRFLWVGDGELRESLEREIRAAGLQERILLAGFRPDLARFYRAADLFVFPTHFEGGASFALVEAMASGAPVVSSDASGIPEVVEDRVHGLLYPAKNADALAATLRYALGHPDAMEAMARHGRERAAVLTEERMCQDTLESLSQLGLSRVP
jgi:glycosyltransferase involved in cell wall biosynthesis